MLSQTPGLFQHSDVEVRRPAARGLVLLHQAAELDGPGQSGRPGTHEQHIHLDGFGTRGLSEDQLLKRQRTLVSLGENRRHV